MVERQVNRRYFGKQRISCVKSYVDSCQVLKGFLNAPRKFKADKENKVFFI